MRRLGAEVPPSRSERTSTQSRDSNEEGKEKEMALEVTHEAKEVLARSLELAGVDPATGGIRLRAARGLGGGTDVQIELADGPTEGEQVLEIEGLRLFVDPRVTEAVPNPLIAVEHQHETVVVRPGGAK